MKKLIAIFSILAITGNVFAQGAGKVSLQDLHITTKATESTAKVGQGQLILPNAQAGSVHVHDINITKGAQSTAGIINRSVVFSGGGTVQRGTNTLTKEGVGTLVFMNSGNAISNVIFRDNAGNAIKLMPEPGTTSTLPAGTWEIRANTKTGFFRLFGDSN